MAEAPARDHGAVDSPPLSPRAAAPEPPATARPDSDDPLQSAAMAASIAPAPAPASVPLPSPASPALDPTPAATAAAAAATAPIPAPPPVPTLPDEAHAEDPSAPEEPVFPLLQNNASSETLAQAASSQRQKQKLKGAYVDDDDNDEEPAVAKPFVRTSSPDPGARDRDRDSGLAFESSAEATADGVAGASESVKNGIGSSAGTSAASAAGAGGRARGHHASNQPRGYEMPEMGDGDGDDQEPPRGPGRSMYKMHKFTLYETASRYYIIGADVSERRYRILKVDRNTHDSDLSITDDKILYTQREMNQLLDTIDDGNKGTGGIRQRCTTWGLLGFIKFTGPYYMLLITKKSTVAMMGGHYVYQIDGTELIPLTPPDSAPFPRYKTATSDARNRNRIRSPEEQRFLAILNNLDLTRSFYYSYSYDVTQSLQQNMTRERAALNEGLPAATYTYDGFNAMFVWNSHLLQPAVDALQDSGNGASSEKQNNSIGRGTSSVYDWCRPIIHGYMDQAALSIYGRTAHITVIARRSRYFAGARFLKRGANDLGYVANDVETEQIVSESLTTPFHLPGPRLFASPHYTSYVQHRGSIPLYWTQDNTGVTPKPPIELNLVDPFYTAAALHFDNLFERYGSPIYVLNLVKAKERTPRESKLLHEFGNAVTYLNQALPTEHRIIYHAWDMSRAAKSRDQNVIGTLEHMAEDVVTTTGFFHNGDGLVTPIQVQNGVARTNCIDCLDRTNAAQFVIGKRALGYQLHALGIIDDTTVEYDTDAVNLFTHMYHDHGDTIAVQYGGSQLVNTMETYRKINQWTSHSRDMIESFKRYYNNSFLDSQRQEAYNLFLGNYIFAQGQPMLWDLATDYYLHHSDPRAWLKRVKPHYIHWYTPAHLERRVLPPYAPPPGRVPSGPVSSHDDYWLEYYRPSTLSSFLKMFSYKMNSTIKYIPFKSTQEGKYDLSPFRVRTDSDNHHHQHHAHSGSRQDVSDKKKVGPKKEVVIVDPSEARNLTSAPPTPTITTTFHDDDGHSVTTDRGSSSRGMSIQRWLHPGPDRGQPQSIMKESSALDPAASSRGVADNSTLNATRAPGHEPFKAKQTPQEKSKAAQWTFTQVVQESLNPTVAEAEMDDYTQYVTHPQTLPLVVSSDAPTDIDASEYQNYLHGAWQAADGMLAAASYDATGGADLGGVAGEDMAAYAELLRIGDSPLTVTEDDLAKKRYKAYRKWLRGKSLFKQQPLD